MKPGIGKSRPRLGRGETRAERVDSLLALNLELDRSPAYTLAADLAERLGSERGACDTFVNGSPRPEFRS